MTKLSERVERLEGPDRKVDCLIAVALGWTLEQFNCTNINGATELGELWFPPNCDEETKTECIAEYRSSAAVNLWPCDEGPTGFTQSLDAAMSLVPEGCLWTMDSWSATGWAAGIWKPASRSWLVYSRKEEQSRTPALALCAAALKARGL